MVHTNRQRKERGISQAVTHMALTDSLLLLLLLLNALSGVGGGGGCLCHHTARLPPLTLSSTKTSPRMSWPVEWPKPHSAPSAEAAALPRPMVSGVSACCSERTQ